MFKKIIALYKLLAKIEELEERLPTNLGKYSIEIRVDGVEQIKEATERAKELGDALDRIPDLRCLTRTSPPPDPDLRED